MADKTSTLVLHQDTIRSQLLESLQGGSAHVDLRTALAGMPQAHYGLRPQRAPHSAWEVLEHMRFTLHDLLDFCINPDYLAPTWPEDYWPASVAPAEPQAWQQAVDALLADLRAFEALVEDPSTDLFDKIAWGQGQTILREVLLAIDHTSYHLGQLVLIRRQLDDWGK